MNGGTMANTTKDNNTMQRAKVKHYMLIHEKDPPN